MEYVLISNKTTFYIKYDGINSYNNLNYITTPFYDYARRSTPYPDLSNNWIKFTIYLLGNGKYIKLNIYDISQFSEGKPITPIGFANAIPFGLDGPHPLNTIRKGIELPNNNGDSGTIWFDVKFINKCNGSQIKYLYDLVSCHSWEVGIHFSEELNKLILKEACVLMEKEFKEIGTKIGFKPITWCSLRNSDNISHAVFAYKEFGMIWRNGPSGLHAESLGGIGNLDDTTWPYWKIFFGMIHPAFTHRTNEQPAIDYSISPDNFSEWLNNYKKLGICIVPFGRWWKINSNTYEASFNNITFNGKALSFAADTNGFEDKWI